MMEQKAQNRRTMVGEVVSDRMDKTVVVKIERTYIHPRLKRVMRTSKKYKVHDEQGQAHVGDVVAIYEGRPVSKTKYMYLSHVVKSTIVQ